MQIHLEAPHELVALLASRGATHPAEPKSEQHRPVLAITAPNQPAVTTVVDLDPGRLVAAGTAIYDWYGSHRHAAAGPWRLLVCLCSGVWGSTDLRPSTRVSDITRFLAKLDQDATDPTDPGATDPTGAATASMHAPVPQVPA